MVQQQPKVSAMDQPTIAIITVNYYEKLAVDAMMTNKVTFVRHKPEGKPILLVLLFYFVTLGSEFCECIRRDALKHFFLFLLFVLEIENTCIFTLSKYLHFKQCFNFSFTN